MDPVACRRPRKLCEGGSLLAMGTAGPEACIYSEGGESEELGGPRAARWATGDRAGFELQLMTKLLDGRPGARSQQGDGRGIVVQT